MSGLQFFNIFLVIGCAYGYIPGHIMPFKGEPINNNFPPQIPIANVIPGFGNNLQPLPNNFNGLNLEVITEYIQPLPDRSKGRDILYKTPNVKHGFNKGSPDIMYDNTRYRVFGSENPPQNQYRALIFDAPGQFNPLKYVNPKKYTQFAEFSNAPKNKPHGYQYQYPPKKVASKELSPFQFLIQVPDPETFVVNKSKKHHNGNILEDFLKGDDSDELSNEEQNSSSSEDQEMETLTTKQSQFRSLLDLEDVSPGSPLIKKNKLRRGQIHKYQQEDEINTKKRSCNCHHKKDKHRRKPMSSRINAEEPIHSEESEQENQNQDETEEQSDETPILQPNSEEPEISQNHDKQSHMHIKRTLVNLKGPNLNSRSNVASKDDTEESSEESVELSTPRAIVRTRMAEKIINDLTSEETAEDTTEESLEVPPE